MVKLNQKNIVGLICFGIGVCFIVVSLVIKQKVTETKGFVDNFTSFFTNQNQMWDPVISFFGGQVNKKISQHEMTSTMMLIAGVVLVVGGAAIFFLNRRKKFWS